MNPILIIGKVVSEPDIMIVDGEYCCTFNLQVKNINGDSDLIKVVEYNNISNVLDTVNVGDMIFVDGMLFKCKNKKIIANVIHNLALFSDNH